MLPKWTSNRIDLEFKKLFDKLIDKVNGLPADAERRDSATNKRIDNLVLQSGGASPNEVVDARVNSAGQSFATLHSRLVAGEKLTALEIKVLTENYLKQKEEISQLNKVIQSLFGGTSQTIDIFISSKIGNDTTATGTAAKPFKTIQSAVNSLPMISSNIYYFWLEPGSYLEDVIIDSIQAGRIFIRSTNYVETMGATDTGCYVRSFEVLNTPTYVNLTGLTFVDTKNSAGKSVNCDLSGYVSIQSCSFSENTKSISGFSAVYSSGNTAISIGSGTTFNNQNICVNARFASHVIVSVKGSGNSIGYIGDASVVRLYSSSPLFATTLKQEKNGGQVLGG
ncbi:hypothetical protein IGI37_000109 [Enterococcus sp. AZ194]|uniref:hypothetical protein n=1 Tax=Enterococcus sp. AZ194 TaxID=2774629 RepID=UPI003F1FE366